MEETTKDISVCCPLFDPAKWDNQEFSWDDKKFIKDSVTTFFFMPLNFGGAMKRLQTKAEKAGAIIQDYMCLSDHINKWNMNVYLAVDKEVPDAENVTLSGKFISKVYEGPYKDTGKWVKDFIQYSKNNGNEIEKMYMWYVYCPKCAKKYGKNYTVILGKIK